MGRLKLQSFRRNVLGTIQLAFLFLITLSLLSGCQNMIKLESEKKVAAIEPEAYKKDITKEFSNTVECFLKGYFLCNGSTQHKVFIKPFGSNYYDMPHLESYLQKICYDKIRLNECIKLVPTIKSGPQFVVESHIVKGGETKLLVNVRDNKTKDIIYTKTMPFMISDIDINDYNDHRANAYKMKKYAYLIVKSDIKTYTYDDTYTVRGPKVEASYYKGSNRSAHYSGEYGGRHTQDQDSTSYNGSMGARASGRSVGSGMYRGQASYTFDIGESAIYPIDMYCYVDGVLVKANDENVFYKNAVEAHKKKFFTFTFVGAEWDALTQTQKRHKKYSRKCYIIPKPDETVIMNVSYVYQKDKKGIVVTARNTNDEKLKVYYYK